MQTFSPITLNTVFKQCVCSPPFLAYYISMAAGVGAVLIYMSMHYENKATTKETFASGSAIL